jgi:hypothetical protein
MRQPAVGIIIAELKKAKGLTQEDVSLYQLQDFILITHPSHQCVNV